MATYPGLKAGPIACYGCGGKVPPRRKCYRAVFSKKYPGVALGYLCQACRQALGPAQRGHYFTRVESVETKQAG